MTHTANHPLFALFGQMVARAWRVSKHRRQFAELKDWSDEQLKDIGLTRSDVRRGLARPFYSDPTSLLNGSAELDRTLTMKAANAQHTVPSLKVVDGSAAARDPLAA
ncbi:DUF1127 domain-containing protein [Roseibium porphyridii]|uniref:DUF1127 domain-containing protein n=1 Tax=Roseibium porphyridii TaxID=2866279 RepID=A0ABY8F4Q9_9HYPH|nr:MULTISPECIES: DUF1127 domain-containing protein [Stappiaceae]QFT33789.1 hypothetical protein FIV00_25060 [Labrenzia sp. THAF82]WFE89042.1 DUF1127 domain-containing protein [Roseibium sp. KMA01]